MMPYYNIYPKKVGLVQFSRILDGTVATLAAMLTDQEAWLSPNRPEDGISVNYSGEMEDFTEAGSSGVLVMKDSVIKRFGFEFTINLGRWDFNIEQMMRGGKASDVAEDHTASIDGADDATAMKGLGIATTLQTEKFGVIMEMPEDKATGKKLYLFVPKSGISFGDREQTLSHVQQANAMTFKAYGLETSNPDELSPVQDIYTQATDDGLIFPMEGEPDVV